MTDDRVRVGVDVGGTFTDVVTIRDGEVAVTKRPSTPDAPDEGVVDALERSKSNDGYEYGSVSFFAHGTTVATNAVLEREWAETALVTTEGFRDVLEIGRQNRPDIYDFDATKPAPVVERDRRFEVRERLDERGRVETPLDEASVRNVASEIASLDLDSVAISLLFAYENPEHERRIRELLVDEGVDASMSLSSDVLPEVREYERTLATTLNAALKPVIDEYVGRLETALTDIGVDAPLLLMQSNGGVIDAAHARERPINTLLSGPAAGVQGAAHVAGLRGVSDVITIDMGGTSCDVSLVQDGDPLVTTDLEVGEYPVEVPMVGVHTIGAGGGSVAWIDAGGALRVGPQSAGAIPGPVCYGRGGEEPTVTDAHLLLGRLDSERLLSEEFEADVNRVESAVEETLADPLNMSVTEAAQGIVDVANANMERALRVVSVERGHDPREFGLVAFGGAGPLHASTLAAALDIPRVFVPRAAGVLSALGLLVTDLVHDFSTSLVRPWNNVSPQTLADIFVEFEQNGRERLASEGMSADRMEFERGVDVRYAGQSFDLTVPVPDGGLTDGTLDSIEASFHDRHDQRYGHSSPDEPLELVTVRTRAQGLVSTPDLAADETADADPVRGTRTVVFDGDPYKTRVYDRSRLQSNIDFDGPAIVEGAESTVVVHPSQRATVDEYGTIVIEVDP